MKKKDKDDDDDAALYHHVDPELEKTIGELIIARFQSRRLKRKLSDKVAGYMHAGGGGYYREYIKEDFASKTIFSPQEQVL
jgi:hypothetical protein